jgi:DNA gyrase subunit B
VLKEMMNLAGLQEDDLGDREKLQKYIDKILILLEKHKLTGVHYRASIETDADNRLQIHMIKQVHGLDHDQMLGRDFFLSPDYQVLGKLGSKLEGLLGEAAYIERADKQAPADSFENVMSWLMAQARKGQNIQRYKGLGEMNPDQLWDTTMNPETRRMLQVHIEDAIAADEVFTTLMGDQVEPRREFIEKNALAANNIDT